VALGLYWDPELWVISLRRRCVHEAVIMVLFTSMSGLIPSLAVFSGNRTVGCVCAIAEEGLGRGRARTYALTWAVPVSSRTAHASTMWQQ
jgi:hypothetical protein